jgi:NAD(P)-dependent dehydrogenase (short-subunit alcohol dehydrogenase family)
MPGRLTNKVAIITGSSSGIGRAIALAFASSGAHIVCSDIRPDFRPEYRTDSFSGTAVEEILKLGAKAIYQKCDTTQSSEVDPLIDKAVEVFGRVDIMVNNAGITVEAAGDVPRMIWEFDEGAFEKTMQVNVKGVFLGTKYATRQMKDQEPHASGDRGWIINLSSVFGLVGGPATCESTSPFRSPSMYRHPKHTTDLVPSRIYNFQTRCHGPRQSHRKRLCSIPDPRQRAVSRLRAAVFHPRSFGSGSRR